MTKLVVIRFTLNAMPFRDRPSEFYRGGRKISDIFLGSHLFRKNIWDRENSMLLTVRFVLFAKKDLSWMKNHLGPKTSSAPILIKKSNGHCLIYCLSVCSLITFSCVEQTISSDRHKPLLIARHFPFKTAVLIQTDVISFAKCVTIEISMRYHPTPQVQCFVYSRM